MKPILILGASGFIGHTLYKELHPYFPTYGTYFSNKKLKRNKQFFHYACEKDELGPILQKIKPKLIISALRGPFDAQIEVHSELVDYISHFNCRLMFISSTNVFDAFVHFPSYEFDKTLSESIYGRFKIKIENMLLRLPPTKYTIIRLPMVFGLNSPRIQEIENLISCDEAIEVFPNTIINVTSDRKLSQQIHYIINHKQTGIFHLGSTDLVTHFDFIKRLAKHRGWNSIKYKQVYTTNMMRYLAVLPKENKLPNYLNASCEEILNDCFVKEGFS